MATAMRRRRQTTQPKEKCSASESSALAALDSALVKGTKKEREFHMPFFGEGDITSLVLQSCGTTRKNDLVDFGSLSPLSLVNRQKSNSNILSTSFDAEIGSLDKDDDCFGSSLAISKCDEFPRPNSRGLSPNYLRSPSPRSTRSRNGLPPSSPPVQRNASRPSSSRSSLVSGIASTTPSAPFKVLVPASLRNEKDEFLTRLAVSERANISRNEGTPKSKHMSDVWDVSDDSSDDETNEIVRHTKRSGQLSTKEKADQTRNDSHQETEKLSTTATDRLVLERGNKNGVADAALRNAKSNTLANVVRRFS